MSPKNFRDGVVKNAETRRVHRGRHRKERHDDRDPHGSRPLVVGSDRAVGNAPRVGVTILGMVLLGGSSSDEAPA